MTGGLGYFLDEDETFPTKVNGEISPCSASRVPGWRGAAQGAHRGARRQDGVAQGGLLENWAEYLPKFWQLVPPSEANTLRGVGRRGGGGGPAESAVEKVDIL